MPIDFDILKEYGTTDAVIQSFFTAEMPSPARQKKMSPEDFRVLERKVVLRKKFEKQISGWLQEHIVYSLNNHSKYAAVDMAWDSMPINQHVLPLIQYAQGRMDIDKVSEAMKSVPNGDKYLRRDKEGNAVGVDMPKFTEVNLNVVRSVLTRRLASQVVKYNNIWPYFKYEARDGSEVGKLRSDMVSQRMDIMADQFGYRHFNTQVMRDMLMYAHCVTFPRAPWERQITVEKSNYADEFVEGQKLAKKTRVVKEGISWVNPHPSRVFYDNNFPLASLNDDIGCEFVGFWDVTRWGNIADNAEFYNRKSVSYTSGMVDWFSTYWAYFNQYFTTIIPPTLGGSQGENSTAMNDRKNQIGLFTGDMQNTSTIYTHLWVKVRPSNWGWGSYPHPIWVHLKVAGDATVIYNKICPSSPAAVYSHNENDSRLINISLAHELMPFQDQLTNLFSQLLEVVKQDLFSVAVLNEDVFPNNDDGKKAREEFKSLLRNKELYASTQLLSVSFKQLEQLGIKPDQAFVVVRSKPNESITNIFTAITQVIGMANNIEIITPHEQGQAASHEQSAHESVELARTTDTMYDFISASIDEGRAAMKRICFESLIACGSDEVELTAAGRYSNDTIKKAGFEAKNPDGDDPVGYTRVTGSKQSLIHDYIFTSRDGANRPAGPAEAQAAMSFLQGLGSLEPDIQKAVVSHMTVDWILELFNTIMRSIDAGVDLKLQRKPGEDNYLTMTPGETQQLQQAVQKMADQLQVEANQTSSQNKVMGVIAQILNQINPQAGQMIAAAMHEAQPQQPNGGPPP